MCYNSRRCVIIRRNKSLKNRIVLLLIISLFYIIPVFSSCSVQNSDVFEKSETISFEDVEAKENLPQNLEETSSAGVNTVIPVAGSDENGKKEESSSVVIPVEEYEEETEEENAEISGEDNPESDGGETQSEGESEALEGTVTEKVSFSSGYIYEVQKNEAADRELGIHINMPFVSYKENNFPRINAFYYEYISDFHQRIITRFLPLLEEETEELSPTVEISFLPIYNEKGILSVISDERSSFAGLISRQSGQTFDTENDCQLSLWDVVQQDEAEGALILPSVSRTLENFGVSFDEGTVMELINDKAFTFDENSIGVYVDCEKIDPSVGQTALVSIPFEDAREYLTENFSAVFGAESEVEAETETETE